MTTIYIEDKAYNVEEGDNLLHACLSLGFDIPYFCWHPALGSVGACRQCAVKQFKDEEDTEGRLVMSCMTPAADKTRLSIDDPEAKAFRASVIEWLMANHPHDCPVCDEGGECHLQDMTVMTGHTYRRFHGKKRTFHNQDLGPFINHEMNRCIQCYRCVRFYRDYAGGRDFDAFALRNHVYFGRHEDGALENEFSGNLVEVCPTGVFTDKTLKRHYTRKWDLQTAPSVCMHCGLGCNTIPGERYGQLRRIYNRYNSAVNGYFLCDRGRYGYEFVNSNHRIRHPLLRNEKSDSLKPVQKDAALQHVKSLLSDRSRVIGIGSPRASLEANFALRALVGPERFYAGVSESDAQLLSLILQILREGPARSASLHDVERADAVFVLGEDVTNVAPRLALALRQAVRQQPMAIADQLQLPKWNSAAVQEGIQHEKGPLFIATPNSTKLDDVATQTYRAAPDDLARLGFAVAHELSSAAPPVLNLPDEVRSLVHHIAQALRSAKRALVVAGASCGSAAVIQAAANVAWALCETDHQAKLCFTVPECNSLGLGLIGGGGIKAAFEAVQDGTADTVIILENDLYRRVDRTTVDAFFHAASHVIAIDHIEHNTVTRAEVVLPASTFAATDGTLVNNEGRAQRFFQVFAPDGEVQESWRWVHDILVLLGYTANDTWRNFDDVVSALAEELPIFTRIPEAAPAADFRVAGQKIPRQPPRYSGRTAMRAHLNVHEPKQPADLDSPLSFSMEGYPGQPPSSLIPYFWAPAWNSVQATGKFQSEVGGPLREGNPGMRLLEPARDKKISYFNCVPEAFAPREASWLLVPLYHIFGSEELSVRAPAVEERSPLPYVALNTDDATDLRVEPGDAIEFVLADATYRLPVRPGSIMPRGVAGLFVGLSALKGITLPAWSTMKPFSPSGEAR